MTNDTIDKMVKAVRVQKYQMRGLDGRYEWENIDELPLTEYQKACVLEWLAQKLEQTQYAENEDIWQYGKSYDPLTIDVENKVAHSYVMDMADGGRHHSYGNMSDIEHYIFNEFFQEGGKDEAE